MRLWGWGALICSAVILLLLPADTYFVSIPVWAVILLNFLLTVCIIMLWRQNFGRRIFRFLITAVAAAAVAFASYACFFSPYWNAVSARLSVPVTKPLNSLLTADEARGDIAYAFRMLMRTHPVLRGFVPEELAQAADEAYRAVRAAEGGLTVAEIGRLTEQMASVLQDAHTGINIWNTEETKYLRSAGIHSRHGDRLTAVNGISVEKLTEEKASLLSAETPVWAQRMIADYLVTDAGLIFLDISPDLVEYTYTTPDGQLITEKAGQADFIPSALMWEITEEEAPTETENPGWVSYRIDAEHDLAVLSLTQCQNTDEYLACLNEMFTEVHKHGISNVVVDLRYNGGGNSAVAAEFIKYLDVESYRRIGLRVRNGPLLLDYPGSQVLNGQPACPVFAGDVYVLTSSATFSSAVLFAEILTDNGLALQIGETPGNITDGYGDIATFQLPNSGLLLNVSTKQFERIDGGSLLEPDIDVPEEEALETLLEILPAKTAA